MNCLCRCVRVETPHFKVCMLDLKRFIWHEDALCQSVASVHVWEACKRKVLNERFCLGEETPPFITVCIELLELIIALLCMSLRENVFTAGSKSNNSRCFLQLCMCSEIFKYAFPVRCFESIFKTSYCW